MIYKMSLRTMLAASCGALSIAVGVGPAIAQARSQTYAIQQQDLGGALRSFALATGRDVMVDPALVRGKTSRPLQGEYKDVDALRRLLEGSGLTFEATRSGAFVIKAAGQAEPVTSSSAEETPATVEELIVTAQKREQRLLDVPLSIAAIGAQDIERRRLVSSEDYLRGMPGVNQVDSNFGPAVTIRGLETSTTSQNFASGSTVAMYFGETSTTTSAGVTGGSGADLKLVDIQRVEVLRGPQGTAFGSSAIGGVVRVIPNPPKLDGFEGKVALAASVTQATGGDNHSVQGVLNLPIIPDKLAVRAVAYRFEDSGFYRNVAGTDPALQAATLNTNARSYAVSDDEVGGSTFTGARVSALLQATDDLKVTVSYVTQKTDWDAWVGSNRGGYDQAILRVGPPGLVHGQDQGGTATDIDLINGVVEYDLGWADLLATYSHIEGGSSYAFPWSTTGSNPMVSATSGDHSEDSGEIRLVTKFDGPLNGLVGVYGEKLEDSWTQTVYWYGSLSSIPFASSVPYTAPGVLNDRTDVLELTQKAVFGELTWEPLDGLKLTGGVRVYEYERTSVSRERGAITAPTASDVLRVTAGTTKASGQSFRANVSYDLPGSDTLVYAGWSQGFRLGKPQPGLPSGLCDVAPADGLIDGTSVPIASTREIQSDSVENWEVGAKGRLLGGRMTFSGDVFRADWEDIPVQVRATCGAVVAGYTGNAGRARSEGVEAQVTFQITPALRLDAGASYVEARLIENAPGLTPPAFAGDRLPAPKLNATVSLEYAFDFRGADAYVRADTVFVGGFNGRVPPTLAARSGDYTKVDLSAGLDFGDVALDFFVKNATNADDITFAPAPYPSLRLRPRTIGVQLAYSF